MTYLFIIFQHIVSKHYRSKLFEWIDIDAFIMDLDEWIWMNGFGLPFRTFERMTVMEC